MSMPDKNAAADVAQWLARETGHTPGAEEGYSDESVETEDDMPKGMGLPNAKHEKMRRFFDGLHVEKSLTEKRRADALGAVDEADQMNQALKGAISPQTPPGGGY